MFGSAKVSRAEIEPFITHSPKKGLNYHLCGFVFAAIVDHNDLVGEGGMLFLQKGNNMRDLFHNRHFLN